MKIFLFHRVTPFVDPSWPPLTPARFEEILRHIRGNHQLVQLETALEQGLTGPKFAAIAFDDGYKDFVEYAMPILDKYRIPASMYLVTSMVSTGRPIWTFLLDHMLTNTTRPKLELSSDLISPSLRIFDFSSDLRRLAYSRALKGQLKKLGHRQKEMILQEIVDQLDDVPPPENQMMNWHDVRQLNQSGRVYFGSHTVNHPILPQIESDEELKTELEQSGSEIQNQLGNFPVSIAYPNGSYDERTKALAYQAGYQYGLAVNQRDYNPQTDDLFSISRIELYQESWFKTRLRMCGFIQKAKSLLDLLSLKPERQN